MKRLAIMLSACWIFLFVGVAPWGAQANNSDGNDSAILRNMQTTLETTAISPAVLSETIQRYLSLSDISALYTMADQDWAIGKRKTFFVIDTAKRKTEKVTAQIFFMGEHCVAWIDILAPAPNPDVVYPQLETFDSEIYEKMHTWFGTEEQPGADDDMRIHILFTPAIGRGLLGYFSSRDQEPRSISLYSNAMDLFLMNTTTLTHGTLQALNTLTHEFQHMIHAAYDKNETSMIDEGLSGLAEYLTGNRTSDFPETEFLRDPNISLTNWETNFSAMPSYGAGFLFFKYLTDRLGTDILKTIVSRPENGLQGVDAALLETGISSAKGITANSLYADWILTHLLTAANRQHAPYAYHAYELPIRRKDQFAFPLPCANKEEKGFVKPYGTVYYSLHCPGKRATVRFNGADFSPVTYFKPMQGRYSWWSNSANQSSAWMQRTFDFTAVVENITLQYDIQVDLEEDYDFLYLSISEDDGKSFSLLNPPHATDKNDSGFNLGFGYTGNSEGIWHEKVDLSAFSGKKVILRFEMITDQAIAKQGALLDQIQINAIGFADDAESDLGGWETSGFVRLFNAVPIQWLSVSAVEAGEQLTTNQQWLGAQGEWMLECDFTDNQTDHLCAWGISPINRFAIPDVRYEMAITLEN